MVFLKLGLISYDTVCGFIHKLQYSIKKPLSEPYLSRRFNQCLYEHCMVCVRVEGMAGMGGDYYEVC